MPLEPGTTLGAYEILERIGEGGMGVVYRAKDTRLGRDVAVKLLSDGFAEDAERLARLQREARILASLNHPGIGAIYSLEEASGTHFLVLELVPGETFAERLARGTLPLREAIPLFAQIAEAMEAAHEHGILHRDLKPSNVKLTPDGKVKILDFGLAKALPPSHPEDSLSSSPTLTRHTEAGIVLGTAPYLSPEQARGRPLDKRTDVWAFGCCLYEALTGKAAFLGETLSDTIANILQREPDWTRLPRSTPPALARLLRRSLEKDPAERLRDLGDARLELMEASREPIAPAPDEKRSWMPWALGLGALGVLLAAIVVPRFAPEPDEGIRLTNVRRVTSFPGDETQPALSPDGEFVLFVSRRSGNRDLWLKNLSGGDPISSPPIPPTTSTRPGLPTGPRLRSGRRGTGAVSTPSPRSEGTRPGSPTSAFARARLPTASGSSFKQDERPSFPTSSISSTIRRGASLKSSCRSRVERTPISRRTGRRMATPWSIAAEATSRARASAS
jgi:serine/threonine protein kinase